MRKDDTIQLRIDTDLKNKFSEIASQESQTTSSLIEGFIRDYCKIRPSIRGVLLPFREKITKIENYGLEDFNSLSCNIPNIGKLVFNNNANNSNHAGCIMEISLLFIPFDISHGVYYTMAMHERCFSIPYDYVSEDRKEMLFHIAGLFLDYLDYFLENEDTDIQFISA